MPSSSKAQHNMMCARCKRPLPGGPSQKTACEYCHADKGKVKNLPDRVKK